MTDAVYLTEETAYLAASYIRGFQVKKVQVVRHPFGGYQVMIHWTEGKPTFMKLWMAEWFSLNKEV